MNQLSFLYRIFLMMALLTATVYSFAQDDIKWEAGIAYGVSIYKGDLNASNLGRIEELTSTYGAAIRFQPRSSWMYWLAVHQGRLEGNDEHRTGDPYVQARNFRFNTTFTDVALGARFLSFPQSVVRPYIGTGLGLVFFQPDAYLLDNLHPELTDRVKLDTEASYKKSAWFIPLDIGVSYKVSKLFSVSLGGRYHFTNTDYLDGISHAGNPLDNDVYGHLYLGANLRLGKDRDQDGDGVTDEEDECPNLPGNPSARGCPDMDGDGVLDRVDKCIYAAGLPEYEGCPDTDGDGIIDPYDRCPTVAGEQHLDGCPQRAAEENVVIEIGAKPDTTHTTDGGLHPNDIDSDTDKIPDAMDRCPFQYGIPLFGGCPDTDGDGIEDIDDACPNAFGFFDAGGCPRFKSTEDEVFVLNSQLLYFSPNSAVITYQNLLDQVALFLREHSEYSLRIHAYADGTGSDESPEYISELRAQQVRSYLLSKGVEIDRLYLQAHGSDNPVTHGGEEAIDQGLNRRVGLQLSAI